MGDCLHGNAWISFSRKSLWDPSIYGIFYFYEYDSQLLRASVFPCGAIWRQQSSHCTLRKWSHRSSFSSLLWHWECHGSQLSCDCLVVSTVWCPVNQGLSFLLPVCFSIPHTGCVGLPRQSSHLQVGGWALTCVWFLWVPAIDVPPHQWISAAILQFISVGISSAIAFANPADDSPIFPHSWFPSALAESAFWDSLMSVAEKARPSFGIHK